MNSTRLLTSSLIVIISQLGACASFESSPARSANSPDMTSAGQVRTLKSPDEKTALRAIAAPAVAYLPVPPRQREELFERLRQGFALPRSDDRAVQQEVAWYTRNHAYLGRLFNRAEDYLHFIAEALDQRGLPSDLALLPAVESAYDPFAYSHGRAAGLWQIIPSTGRQLGLTQNWWFDGRRDIVESTRAALDYLETLHAQFDGDWLLAVAGYNAGEGNVARAILRARSDDEPTDFWHIRKYLPLETQTYVPRLLAIRDLVAIPSDYGVELPAIPNTPKLTVVPTGGQMDMAVAANLAGLEIDELYRLNPGVNRWATDPDGHHRLVVPVSHRMPLESALAELRDDARVKWTRHRISRGETLSGLARRYRTAADLLSEINELDGNMIRAGDYLLVPTSSAAIASYTGTIDARTNRLKNRDRSGERRVHVVRGGDSLWAIARQYGISVRELAKHNAMAPNDVLNVGVELIVWTPTTARSRPTSPAVPARQIRQVDYVVSRGDSLYSIARRFRLPIGRIAEWNDLAVDDYLQPGQRLTLFVNVAEQSS